VNPLLNSTQKHDVMLTVDACSYSTSLVELAVAIAASAQSRLHGRFIEDQDLLGVADLPFSREISSTTVQQFPTDTERMQRSLMALGVQFKNTLQRSAQASNVSWSYDYVQGRRDEICFEKQQQVSFTIIARTLLQRNDYSFHSSRHRLLVVDNPSVNLEQVIQVLIKRFGHDRVEITWVKNQRADSSQTDESLIQLLQDRANLTLVTTRLEDLNDILSSRAHIFDYAIISRLESAGLQRQLVNTLECPVILVS